jgi:acetate---CoA ligase (ADP-forming) subunit beta
MTTTLSEFESKQLLRDVGVLVPDDRLVDSADAAVAAAQAIGLPVALKLCGRHIAHKTERNLVRLGLAHVDAVRQQAQELLACRGPDEADARLLVSPMVRGRREVIAGLIRDPQFGPCVMLGIGGIFAEALGDVAFAVAPLEPHDADTLIDSLQYAKLLGPFRGEPAVDREALRRVLEGLARLGVERPDIRSIDVNPLILDQGRPVAVDALVELEESAA